MTDVFISYKREERDKVILVADRLRALGLDVWFDARLTTGHHFDREIDDHVRTAKCVLVCWSPAALTSDWVRAEAAIGRERAVIVPLLIEACTPPVPFNTIQTESLVGWSGEGDADGWLRALERIGALTSRDDLASAERMRGAREVETRRLQAMLDAQRREEEQAQRRAEAASAERTRLERELSERGAREPSFTVAKPPTKAADVQAATVASTSSFGKEERRKKSTRLLLIGAAVVGLAASVAGSAAGGYFFGETSGRSLEQEFRERDTQERAGRLTGYWCSVRGDSPFRWGERRDGENNWIIRTGYGLASRRYVRVEPTGYAIFAPSNDGDGFYHVVLYPTSSGGVIAFSSDGELAGFYERCEESDTQYGPTEPAAPAIP